MRYWPAIALGLGVVALVALVLPLVQSQRHLSEVRAELGRTNGQLVQATGTISNLKAELNSAQSQLKDREAQVQELTTELEKTRRDADQKVAAEHEASQSQIAALSKAADDAKAKLPEAEKQIADLKEQSAIRSSISPRLNFQFFSGSSMRSRKRLRCSSFERWRKNLTMRVPLA